jgi:hypothetical protein
MPARKSERTEDAKGREEVEGTKVADERAKLESFTV